MRKLTGELQGLARWGGGQSFGLLMVAVLIQLLERGGEIAAPIWTEELSRFALFYHSAFGAGLAIRSGDMVNVDLIREALPGNWPWRSRLFSAPAMARLWQARAHLQGGVHLSRSAIARGAKDFGQ